MKRRTPDLLLVRGAPGVGKSSAVRKLRRLLPGGAIIEVDHVRGMIAAVRWVDTEQHLMTLELVHALAFGFLERGLRPVVVVDTFSRGKLGGFVASLERPYRVASLFALEEVLVERVLGRPADQFRDLSACRLLNREVSDNRYDHEQLVDTSALTPGEVAAALVEVLHGGAS